MITNNKITEIYYLILKKQLIGLTRAQEVRLRKLLKEFFEDFLEVFKGWGNTHYVFFDFEEFVNAILIPICYVIDKDVTNCDKYRKLIIKGCKYYMNCNKYDIGYLSKVPLFISQDYVGDMKKLQDFTFGKVFENGAKWGWLKYNGWLNNPKNYKQPTKGVIELWKRTLNYLKAFDIIPTSELIIHFDSLIDLDHNDNVLNEFGYKVTNEKIDVVHARKKAEELFYKRSR